MRSAIDIIKDIKNKIYLPVYFLGGEEAFYINKISDYIEDHVLDAEEKELNCAVLYGREINISQLLSKVKSFPMMSNYQVVILKNAQDIPDKDFAQLHSYLEKPLDSTILVISYHKKIGKKLKNLLTKNKKSLEFFESVKLKDYKIADWIESYIKRNGFSSSPKISHILADYLGNDLEKIENELQKLIINLEKGQTITMDDVENNIGISKNYNIFELQSAIALRNHVKAIQISHYFAANTKDHSIFAMIPILFSFFSKLLIYQQSKAKSDKGSLAKTMRVNPYFLSDYEKAARNYSVSKIFHIIKLLREYDLKAKGVKNQFPEGEIIKELIYKIVVLS